jgi:hypothetical protein
LPRIHSLGGHCPMSPRTNVALADMWLLITNLLLM